MNSRYFFTRELTFNHVSKLFLKKEPNIIMIISKRSQIKCVQAKTSTTKYLGMECILDNEIPTTTIIMIEQAINSNIFV